MYSVKTALRESFDETHGGSFVFIMRGEEFKPLRAGWRPRGKKSVILSPHVFRKNCPTRKFLTEHMGAPLCLSGEGLIDLIY